MRKMFLGMMQKNWQKMIVWLVALAFFLLPFFWYPKGAIDVGGDGSRLYFYDPINFLKSTALYSIAPEGKEIIDPTKHAYLIYVLFIGLLDYLFHSPSIVIDIWNGIKLSLGFLSIYFIVKELIINDKRFSLVSELAAIFAGIFYILATGSSNLIFFWIKALHSHDQVFLNPLVFLLLLKYSLTGKKRFLFIFLFISLIFSTNFSLISAPPFFAFYPLAFVFLLVYVIYIRKKKINIKEVGVGFILFLGLQAFHLLPSIMNVLQPGSIINTVVFDKASNLKFFDALRGYGIVSTSFLIPPPVAIFNWISVIVPLVILCSYTLIKRKNSVLFLTSLFFFLTLFLVSANITNIGFALYRLFFYLPGFSMFRHFYIQWAFIFIFFYTLLFGQCLAILFERLKLKYVKIFSITISLLFIIGYWQFLNGHLVDAIQLGSRDVRTAMIMDPRYEQTLAYIRTLPQDGKVLMIPITDNFNQVIFGLNNAAYVGPSSISFLTSKKSFEGYQSFDNPPYILSNAIINFAKQHNYAALTQLFSLLNIRYIYHDSDPKIYEEKFPNFPNSYMMPYLPKTQKEYTEFLQHFPIQQIYKNGPYKIYQFNDKVYRPEIYVPDTIIFDDMIKSASNSALSYRSAFINVETCRQNNMISQFCFTPYLYFQPKITVEKINPVQYIIQIQQKSNKPFILVFQNDFDKGWKLSFNGKNIDEKQHIVINTYANAWIILPNDHASKYDYVLSLTLETQKYFWYGLIITGGSLAVIILLSCFFVIKTYVKKT